jgi:hypothetical protein
MTTTWNPQTTEFRRPNLLATIEAVAAESDRLGPATEASQLRETKAITQLTVYHEKWKDDTWQPISVEEEYLLPVVNPDTRRYSRIWQQAGKFDGVVENGSGPCLLEHKTASGDIDDFNSTYWKQLTVDSQVSQYMLASWQMGLKLQGTVYDVIRKPTIRPSKITQANRKLITSLPNSYCGHHVPPEVVQAVVNGQTVECATLYGIRLLAKMREEPDKYLQRRFVPRLDRDLFEYAQELWHVCKEVQSTRLNAKRQAEPESAHFKNSGACMMWGRACEYLDICSGCDTPDSDKWEKVDNVHSELDMKESSSRDVVTHSRLKCYHACRRKHYYRYELGIRRVDEDIESLQYGRLIHVGLEAWWGSMLPEKGETDGSGD